MRTLVHTLAFVVALTSLVSGQTLANDIILGAGIGNKVKVQIKKTSSNPGARKIQYSAKHPGVLFTPGGGATDDPPTNGAAAVIFSATDCQCLTLAPAPTVTPGWTQSPASGTAVKYRWKDDATKSTAQVAAGKINLKKRDGITYGLDALPQGEVEVQIAFGDSAHRFCTRFAAPSAANDTATRYKATVASPGFGPGCNAVPGICPCATTTTTTTISTSTTTTTLCTACCSDCCSGNQGLLSFEMGLATGNCGVLRNFRCSNDANQGCVVNSDCGASNTCNEVTGGGLPQNLACGGLYTGGGGNAVPLPIPVPDMGRFYTQVTSCNPSTGEVISGPTAAGDGGGIVTSRTCTTGRTCTGGANDGATCVLDADCDSDVCATNCTFGAPLPIPNVTTPPTSMCSVSDVSEDASGTTQCDGGDMDVSLPLRFNFFVTGDLFKTTTPPNIPGVQPCPLCDTFCIGGTNADFPCDGNSDCNSGNCATQATCLGGANDGLNCTPATSDSATLGDAQNAYPTSHDCPPGPFGGPLTAAIGGLPMAFSLTSGTVQRNARDLNAGSGGSRVFAGFCRDSLGAGSGCFEGDADGGCPAAIPPATGDPVPCDSNADCADADEYESCAQRTAGAFSRAAATQISVFGSSDGQCLGDGTTHAATLVSVFDIAPTFDSLVDGKFDLPGPGAVLLQGAAQLSPSPAFTEMGSGPLE